MMPACSSGSLTNVLPHRNAMPHTHTGHDTPPCHRIQTLGRPVVVLTIDVEHHTGIHNYHFNVLCHTWSGNPSTNLPHTRANAQFNDAVKLEVSQKLSRKCTVPGPDPGRCNRCKCIGQKKMTDAFVGQIFTANNEKQHFLQKHKAHTKKYQQTISYLSLEMSTKHIPKFTS